MMPYPVRRTIASHAKEADMHAPDYRAHEPNPFPIGEPDDDDSLPDSEDDEDEDDWEDDDDEG